MRGLAELPRLARSTEALLTRLPGGTEPLLRLRTRLGADLARGAEATRGRLLAETLRVHRGGVVGRARRRRVRDRGLRLHTRRHQLRRFGVRALLFARGEIRRLHDLGGLGAVPEPLLTL
ncbi:hypothetical protein [Saccharomonospora sp.]|uniref:hypothetical protein n=1 Tax=Saccharomonospora sp. TaxID=33913 RepID=UPI003418C658